MKPVLFRLTLLLTVPLTFGLSSCISWNKVPIPFVGKSDKPEPVKDIEVPYHVQQTLGYGHTLKFTAYAGQRSPSKLYSGNVTVDQEGVIDLGDYGRVKVGGHKADVAAQLIGSAFRKKRGESIINIQLESIENVPLVLINGAVKKPGAVQWFDDATTLSTLPYVGGHDGNVPGQAVYITRKGQRKFFATAATTEGGLPLEAGDIVNYSFDL